MVRSSFEKTKPISGSRIPTGPTPYKYIGHLTPCRLRSVAFLNCPISIFFFFFFFSFSFPFSVSKSSSNGMGFDFTNLSIDLTQQWFCQRPLPAFFQAAHIPAVVRNPNSLNLQRYSLNSIEFFTQKLPDHPWCSMHDNERKFFFHAFSQTGYVHNLWNQPIALAWDVAGASVSICIRIWFHMTMHGLGRRTLWEKKWHWSMRTRTAQIRSSSCSIIPCTQWALTVQKSFSILILKILPFRFIALSVEGRLLIMALARYSIIVSTFQSLT